ncbi:MAG: guanylate kinase [Clostridiales bacterium]|nr:guanylate kinase [Clostridiales bacterium]
MYEGQLFVVSGPSGAGKGTICRMLIDQVKVSLSVSMTTRTPRAGEINGENYYFITRKKFESIVESEGFLEYAEVYGNYYGTPKQTVLDLLKEGEDVILEIDIQGALKIKEQYPEGIFIYILPPSMGELRKRLTRRGSETEDVINQRIKETLTEVSYIDKYDYCVVNGELNEAVTRIKAIITAEHSRVSHDVYELIDKYREEM